jgi:FlaA1/EpsC-like NDP-sugar epimerase
LAFYDAMLIFSRKYRHLREAFLPSWLIFIGIIIQAAVHISVNLFRSLRACFIDVGLINLMLWGSMVLRFELKGLSNPYGVGGGGQMIVMHLLLSAAFVWSFVYRGVYTQGRYSVRNTLVSGLLASTLFMAGIYMIQSLSFSRIGFGFAALGSTLLLALWRLMVQRMAGSIRRLIVSTGSVVVVGDGLAAQLLIHNIESDPTALIEGVVWPQSRECPGVFEGYPVLGSLEDLSQLLRRRRIDMLLIATTHPWYSQVIEALASSQISKMVVRWVPHEILNCSEQSLPQKIPLHDFSV